MYIYLEPKWPLFLKVKPPKQRLFQSKQGSSKGSRDNNWINWIIYISNYESSYHMLPDVTYISLNILPGSLGKSHVQKDWKIRVLDTQYAYKNT